MENETFNGTVFVVDKHSSVYYANPADGSIKEGIICENHGYETQSKIWKQIPQQAANDAGAATYESLFLCLAAYAKRALRYRSRESPTSIRRVLEDIPPSMVNVGRRTSH